MAIAVMISALSVSVAGVVGLRRYKRKGLVVIEGME
jgi:hypothetical protein